MPVTQYEIAPLMGAALWGFLEKALTLRLATATANEAIEVSPVWFVVRDEALYFAVERELELLRPVESGARLG